MIGTQLSFCWRIKQIFNMEYLKLNLLINSSHTTVVQPIVVEEVSGSKLDKYHANTFSLVSTAAKSDTQNAIKE